VERFYRIESSVAALFIAAMFWKLLLVTRTRYLPGIKLNDASIRSFPGLGDLIANQLFLSNSLQQNHFFGPVRKMSALIVGHLRGAKP
jgi:hypothetical protein